MCQEELIYRLELIKDAARKIIELREFNAHVIDKNTKIIIMQLPHLGDKEKAKIYINRLKEISYTKSKYYDVNEEIFSKAKEELCKLVQEVEREYKHFKNS